MFRNSFAGVLSILVLTAAVAGAQESRGAITGRVLDSQGGVVPGAKVAVTNTATNETRRGQTNSTGYYEFNYLEDRKSVV